MDTLSNNIFYDAKNIVKNITPEDYKQVNSYIKSIETIAKSWYGNIYIMDFYAHNFLFISSNPLFLCGTTPDNIKNLGSSFYTTYLPQKDFQLFLKAKSLFFHFLQKQSLDDRTHFYLNCNFQINHHGNLIMINHKLSPIALDASGCTWLAICYVTLSNHTQSGNIEIRRFNDSIFWEYNFAADCWIVQNSIKLTDGEKEVLLLSARGYTVDEIAIKINKAKDTIKSRRKNIFKKLNVRSIGEAIISVQNYNLL